MIGGDTTQVAGRDFGFAGAPGDDDFADRVGGAMCHCLRASNAQASGQYARVELVARESLA